MSKVFASIIISEADRWTDCKEQSGTPNRSDCVDTIKRYFGGETKPEPWCAEFVWMVVNQACYILGISNPLPRTKSTRVMLSRSPKAGVKVNKNPSPGCIFFKTRSGGGHVGFVASVKGNTIYTIEGNVNDSVTWGEREIREDFEFIHIQNITKLPWLLRGINVFWTATALVGAYFTWKNVVTK